MADIYMADDYINLNVIEVDDWVKADDTRKERILNVATSTIQRKYPHYTIPENAIYEFCATLASLFNSTNKLQMQGVTGLTIDGVSAFQFNDKKTSFFDKDIADYIPKSSLHLIGQENGVNLSSGLTVGRMVF
ncbi:MAG: hypothetical protein ACQET8_22670 [Bacillota bacterium]